AGLHPQPPGASRSGPGSAPGSDSALSQHTLPRLGHALAAGRTIHRVEPAGGDPVSRSALATGRAPAVSRGWRDRYLAAAPRVDRPVAPYAETRRVAAAAVGGAVATARPGRGSPRVRRDSLSVPPALRGRAHGWAGPRIAGRCRIRPGGLPPGPALPAARRGGPAEHGRPVAPGAAVG